MPDQNFIMKEDRSLKETVSVLNDKDQRHPSHYKSIHKSVPHLHLLWSLIHDLMRNSLCMHVSNSS